jgi:hypothetical protein
MQGLNKTGIIMNRIKISWEVITKSPLKIKYYFNGRSAGFDSKAFEKIIQLIKADTKAESISFAGRSTGSNNSSGSIQSSLPFYSYWEELMAAVGKRKIILDIK